MRLFKRALFYISLGIMFIAHVFRYTLLRFFRKDTHVHGVRIIMVRAGRVVLLRHWFAPHVWALPGGLVEKGEDVREAARREAYEETGYTINSFGGAVGTYEGRLGPRDNVTVLYTEDFTGGLKFLPNIEIMERGLFDINNLPPNTSPANRRKIESYAKGLRGETGPW